MFGEGEGWFSRAIFLGKVNLTSQIIVIYLNFGSMNSFTLKDNYISVLQLAISIISCSQIHLELDYLILLYNEIIIINKSI